ncbi:MAG: hypothetical protein ACLUVV_02905 [Christensenellales bacterium]
MRKRAVSLSRALIELARAYNRFYYEERIITENSAQTARGCS